MEKQTMTIHRALSELKLIDAKITKQTAELMPVGAYQKGKKVNGVHSESDFKDAAVSKYTSIIDLIDRKNKIKSAIVKANGETKITVAGKSMTVADAITQKSAIALKKNLVSHLRANWNAAIAGINRNNETVQKNLQAVLEVTFGKDHTKVGPDDMDNVRKPFLESNEFHMADPFGIEKKIEELTKEIDTFEMEVDAVLSEANAITKIEI